ncbi:MAG TPA: hypothetical protein VF070_07195 [Streptosporangiaceae bacterium]
MSTAVWEALRIERPIAAPLATVPRLTAALSKTGAVGIVMLTWFR